MESCTCGALRIEFLHSAGDLCVRASACAGGLRVQAPVRAGSQHAWALAHAGSLIACVDLQGGVLREGSLGTAP